MQPEYTGKKGRKPQTEAEKAAKKKKGLKVDTFLESPPAGLDPLADSEWRRVGKYLHATDRVARLDVAAMTAYATSYAIYAEAARSMIIGRKAIWSYIRGRPKPSKILDVYSKHGELVVRLSRRFCATAKTRHLDAKATDRPASARDIFRAAHDSEAAARIEWQEEDIEEPAWLDSTAKLEWARLIEQLDALGLWTPLDYACVAVAASSFSLMLKCARGMKDERLTLPVEDSDAHVEHPLGVVYSAAVKLCDMIWQEYGMTPLDRQQFYHADGESQGAPELKMFPGA